MTVTAAQIIEEFKKEIEYYQSKIDQINALKSKYIDKNANRLHDYQVQATVRGLVSDVHLYEDKINSVNQLISKIEDVNERLFHSQSCEI